MRFIFCQLCINTIGKSKCKLKVIYRNLGCTNSGCPPGGDGPEVWDLLLYSNPVVWTLLFGNGILLEPGSEARASNIESCSESWSDSFIHIRILLYHIIIGPKKQPAGTHWYLQSNGLEKQTMQVKSMPKLEGCGTKRGPKQMALGPQNTAVEKGLIYLTNLILVSVTFLTSEARKISYK